MRGKTCPACGRELPLDAFHVDRARPDGLCAYCKDCKRARNNEAYARRRVRAMRAALRAGKEKGK